TDGGAIERPIPRRDRTESFTLSQSYYYGQVVDAYGKPVAHKENGAGVEAFPTEYRVELIDGQPLDLCDELDRGAISKSGGTKTQKKPDPDPDPDPRPEDNGRRDWNKDFGEIITGNSFHPTLTPLASSFAACGVPEPRSDADATRAAREYTND